MFLFLTICFVTPPSPTFVKNHFFLFFWHGVDLPPSYLDNVCKYTVLCFWRNPLVNFWSKIFNKHWSGLKIKVSIFMEVFVVINHPLWVSPALNCLGKPFFSAIFCVGGDAPLWLLAGIHRKLCHHQLRAMPIHRGWTLTLKLSMETLTFIFSPPQCLWNIWV